MITNEKTLSVSETARLCDVSCMQNGQAGIIQ